MTRQAVLALTIAGVMCPLAALADPVADFYKDKTVTVVSAGEAGGAHGAYAQLIAAHIKKYIPGSPAVVIQYMLGAGGNLAPNYLYSVAPKDGTAIGLPLQDLIFNARIGVQAVKYDAGKVHYLGGADVTRTTVSVMKRSGIATLEDAKRKEVLMGSTGKSGQTYIIPVVLNSILGTKFRPVIGYQGINLIHLAMARGEIDGFAASWPTIAATKKDWVEQHLINNLVTIAMEREPDLPDVPALSEIVTSDADKELIPLLAGSAARGLPSATSRRTGWRLCAKPGPRPWSIPRSAPRPARTASCSIRCPGSSSRRWRRRFWRRPTRLWRG